jgi:hypothetical protein
MSGPPPRLGLQLGGRPRHLDLKYVLRASRAGDQEGNRQRDTGQRGILHHSGSDDTRHVRKVLEHARLVGPRPASWYGGISISIAARGRCGFGCFPAIRVLKWLR